MSDRPSGHYSLTFSVVIPTCNGEWCIKETIDSVLSQTYPHFRLFILESGSTDGTLNIIRAYHDPRIILLTTSESLGILDNWSRILELDLDPYLTIFGHDDVMYPNFLHEIVQLVEAEPNASLYSTHLDLLDGQGSIRRPCRPIPYRETADEWLFNFHQFKRDSFGAGYVFRSEDYKRLGGFTLFPDLMFADDMTTYRFSRLAYKVCSPQTGFAFRVHEHSASHVVKLEMVYDAAKQYIKALDDARYFNDPAHRIAAINFVTFIFNAHYHRVLADLIGSDDTNQLQHYERVKAYILADHARAPLFTVYDTPSKIYERLAYLHPRWLRMMAYQVVKLIRWYRAKRLQKRLNKINS